nr:hypothetical protein [Tanacetum cinerariifolium]
RLEPSWFVCRGMHQRARTQTCSPRSDLSNHLHHSPPLATVPHCYGSPPNTTPQPPPTPPHHTTPAVTTITTPRSTDSTTTIHSPPLPHHHTSNTMTGYTPSSLPSWQLPDSSSNIWGVCLGCRTAAELYGVFAWAAEQRQL